MDLDENGVALIEEHEIVRRIQLERADARATEAFARNVRCLHSLLLLCFTFCKITKQFVRLKQVRLQRCKWKISDVRRNVIERTKDPREDRKVLEEKLAEDRDPAQLGLIDAGKRLDLEEAERWRVSDIFLLALALVQ